MHHNLPLHNLPLGMHTSPDNFANTGEHMTLPRILIIDDEEAVRETLRQALEHQGVAVTCAPNGRVAMNIYRKEYFDLVITELLMPERDGLEVIMDLRKQAPSVKIIAMSGGGQTGMYYMLAVAEKLGATRSLTKPFTPNQLLTAVREVLAE